MNYNETLSYMYSQLPMYQRMGRPAFKPDLSNSWKLMKLLGNPQDKFPSVHIAGTNGKGSTASFITSVLMESGLRVGLYTSPHLTDFRERITVNGEMVSKDFVVDFMAQYKDDFSGIGLSFFEMTVGMAFAWFATQKVDVAVVEVGMGGRLDSTNVIHPILSVITNIGFDHTFFLGDTLEKIAGEKAGIIKEKTPVVIGRTHPETKPVFLTRAKKNRCTIAFADEEIKLIEPVQQESHLAIQRIEHKRKVIVENMQTPLHGIYQNENIATAMLALEPLKVHWQITADNIRDGFCNVLKNTGFRGRWQKLSDVPLVYCDTGHNADGLVQVMQQLKALKKAQIHFVLSVVNDKDLDNLLTLLPSEAIYYFCKADIPRGLSVDILEEKAKASHLNGLAYKSVGEAFESAKTNAGKDDVVFVGGSTFTVAEVL